MSCRAGNELAAAQKILEALNEGKQVAYASDRGNPFGEPIPGPCWSDILAKRGIRWFPYPGRQPSLPW